jgi:predicted outer membrane protein
MCNPLRLSPATHSPGVDSTVVLNGCTGDRGSPLERTMNRNLFALAWAFTLAALVVIGTNAFAHDPRKAPARPLLMQQTGSMQLHQIMVDAAKQSVPSTGNVDKDFATMMTLHHQMGIRMMDVMIKRGHNPQLKALAESMKTAQQDEIRQMTPFTQ